MTHEDAFLQEILERPEDDVPRLIFADWLEDNGQPHRAEFIRLQIELSRLGDANGQVAEPLRQRVGELLDEHDEEWAGPVIGQVANGWEFHRGFVHALTVEGPVLAARSKELFAAGPIRHLRLLDAGEVLGRVAFLPQLSRMLSLDLANNHLGDAGLGRLALSPYLDCVGEL